MWQQIDNQLYKKFSFNDFNESMDFVNRVAATANQLNHHPAIKIDWADVELWSTSHDKGNKVTEKDQDLTAAIDALIKQPKTVQDAAPEVIKLYADGGSRGNPGPSASGFVLLDHQDNVLKKSGVYLGITTNNQAEYLALKYGLEEAHKLGVREVNVFMDSLLVVNQMKGIFKVKNRDLWPIHEAIKESAKLFRKVSYTHVPRELNKLADAEVNETLDAARDQS